jgi:hypothetical protein
VKIPERLSAELSDSAYGIDEPPRSVLGPGSPVRYYLPAAPVTIVGTLGAVINGLGSPCSQRWLTISTSCWISGAALTAYLVRKVNLKLFFAAEPPPPAEREALLRTWHRLNVLRTAAAGCVRHSLRKAGEPENTKT